MKKYKRISLDVDAIQYETDKQIEDGFELWTKIVTNGWIVTDDLIKIIRPDGKVVCPFIQNRRGIIFIRKGDYIIFEDNGEKHICGEDKFQSRFTLIE